MIAIILGLLVLVVGVPLNLYVTIRLWRLAHAYPNLRVLRERAIVATAILLVVTVFALVFLNNNYDPPLFGLEATKIVTRGAALAVAVVPAAYWVWLYRNS